MSSGHRCAAPAAGHREADLILDQASRHHQRVMRELAFVKNKDLRENLMTIAMKAQEEGHLARRTRA